MIPLIEILAGGMVVFIIVMMIRSMEKDSKRNHELHLAKIKANATPSPLRPETSRTEQLKALKDRKAELEREKHDSEELVYIQRNINALEKSMFGLDNELEDAYVNRTENPELEKPRWREKGGKQQHKKHR